MSHSQNTSQLTPLVSVIVPTYNRAHLIVASIESVLRQSYTHFELLVVDDGSTDYTEAEIKKFSDARLIYLKQENRGRSNARNHALSLAKGEFITFLDSDDLYLPDKIALQVAYLQAHPETEMVYTSAHCIDEQGKRLEHQYIASVSGHIYESIAFFTPVTITLPTVMTYKHVMDKAGGFDEAMSRFEDTDMWRRISLLCRIDAMPEFTCLLRTHSDNHLLNQNAEQICQALEYYAGKLHQDPVETTTLNSGLARLYEYYASALLSIPEFAEYGRELMMIHYVYRERKDNGGAPVNRQNCMKFSYLLTAPLLLELETAQTDLANLNAKCAYLEQSCSNWAQEYQRHVAAYQTLDQAHAALAEDNQRLQAELARPWYKKLTDRCLIRARLLKLRDRLAQTQN